MQSQKYAVLRCIFDRTETQDKLPRLICRFPTFDVFPASCLPGCVRVLEVLYLGEFGIAGFLLLYI